MKLLTAYCLLPTAYRLLLTAYCLLFAATGYSQTSATEGTEFYVAFTNNYLTAATHTGLACQVRYVVTEGCYITAQYGDGTYLDNNVYYAPGVYTRNTDKTKSYYSQAASGTATQMIRITSTKNIGVFALNMLSNTTDATTVLPVTALGNEYTILSHSNLNIVPGLYIVVIAPTSGTTFTIRQPNGTAVLSNQSITAYNRPYFYYMATGDFTGYTVESNHNVAVFSTVTCGTPAPGGACDHNYEQMWPVNTAGKNYLLWSMSPVNSTTFNPEGYDSYKIVALENSTTVTKKVGAASTAIVLNKNQASPLTYTPGERTDNPYVNNSTGMVEFTSDKPFIVEHILGFAPCIKWIAPIEQRVTTAMLTPFVPAGSSVIAFHRLHVMIPVGAVSNMVMKETRGGVTTNETLTFYTNTTNPNYVIAYKQYTANDNVLIELANPAGFIAYMVGYGQAESYIFTAGAGALNLQVYYTITTKTTPLNDVYYTETEAPTHTFVSSDNITLKRTIEKPFTQVRWLVNGASYTVTENTNTSNTVTIPASALGAVCGSHTISMSVRYSGATADSVYTGTIWLNNPPTVSVAVPSTVCVNSPTTFTATVSSGLVSPMTYIWDINGTTTTTATNTYIATLTTTTTYSVSVKNANGCTSPATAPQTITPVPLVVPAVNISGAPN